MCKNFTVYLFRENRDRFRMAEYPDTPLVIPDNKPREECTDYVYGVEWKDVPASEGNPFYVAASFRYDPDKTKEENWADARAFLKQVQRGDYFQMAANYYYGVGAHSMIFIEDYDPETDTVTWTDSNMRGATRNGGALRLCAVRRGEGNRLVRGRVLPQEIRRDALPPARRHHLGRVTRLARDREGRLSG